MPIWGIYEQKSKTAVLTRTRRRQIFSQINIDSLWMCECCCCIPQFDVLTEHFNLQLLLKYSCLNLIISYVLEASRRNTISSSWFKHSQLYFSFKERTCVFGPGPTLSEKSISCQNDPSAVLLDRSQKYERRNLLILLRGCGTMS